MTPAEVRTKRATVVGGARSGRAVAQLLAEAGSEVFLTEHGPPPEGTVPVLEEYGIDFEFNGHTVRALDADFFVLSPGVPTQSNIVQQALRAGLDVYSEIEVASWFCEAPIVAITGTNGKTTTTSLTGHVFRQAFEGDPDRSRGRASDREAIVAGNIGYPFSDYVLDVEPTDVVVLEVSSFQLDHVDTFRPRVSVVLNIAPDHLGRYDDFEAYAQAKFNIFRNQEDGDVMVYNHDDDLVRDAAERARQAQDVRLMAMTLETVPDAGGGLRDDHIVLRTDDEDEPLMPHDELALRGRHNVYNSLAAAVSARVMEVENDVIRESLSGFEGVPHRLEEVRTIDGVLYVNDSKATNVNAVWYALESFDRPVVLIAGGARQGQRLQRPQAARPRPGSRRGGPRGERRQGDPGARPEGLRMHPSPDHGGGPEPGATICPAGRRGAPEPSVRFLRHVRELRGAGQSLPPPREDAAVRREE